MIYQVKDWSNHFENNKSRERDKCRFVCVPNKQHGMGFRRVMNEADGSAIYGIWICIIGAVSQQSDRDGWLTADGQRTGTAWAADDLALKFGRPQAEIQRAIEFLSSPKVGWLIAHESVEESTKTPINTGVATQLPAECPPSASSVSLNRREEKGIEVNGKESPLPPTGENPEMPNPFNQSEHEDAAREKLTTPEAPPSPKAKGPLQLRAEKLMGRRPETPLTANEERALKKNKACIVATTEDDWIKLEAFYAAPQNQTFARKDLCTLLNNWNGEIDRAKAWNPDCASRAEKVRDHDRYSRELASLGKLSDHDKDSVGYKRIKELRPVVEKLAAELGKV